MNAIDTETIHRRMRNWLAHKAQTGCLRKRSSSNLKYHPAICLEWLRITAKDSVVNYSGRDLNQRCPGNEPGVPIRRLLSTNHMTNYNFLLTA